MQNFDRISENYGFKEVAIYNDKGLIIGFKVDRYKKDINNIFTFEKTIKEKIF
jgi:hypothetical protein